MKNGIWTIMKKELTRFFTDRRLIFTTILMPGILIYLLYSLMGSAIAGMYTPEAGVSEALVANLPASIAGRGGEHSLSFVEIEGADAAQYKQEIAEGGRALLVVFPEDFDERVADYTAGSGSAPNVEIYYNSSNSGSAQAYQNMVNLLSAYENSIANKFDVNAGGGTYDLASARDTSATFFATLLPMLLMIFLFSGCMAVAPESIAGEKERGTITTILVTPIRRHDLAIGKIAALSIVALLSGVSSGLGTILSFPKLMGGADLVDAGVYGPREYSLLLLLILSTVLLIVTAISIISAFAKTVKEAQTYVSPLMVLVVAIGITAMFGAAAESPVLYLIPFYNSVQCMAAIFSFEVVPVNFIIGIAANVVYTGLGVLALSKMFQSERILFSR